MRIFLSPKAREQGSVLMVSLWTMLIIGIALLTYLQLAKNQKRQGQSALPSVLLKSDLPRV